MSDFDGVQWLENITKPPVVEKKEIAPPGVHSARVITAEKYKSQSGNWTVRVVYEINNGKIGSPIKGATLIGDGPSILKEVSMVGNDMMLDPGIGTCGKAGQGVPVGVAQPSILINKMTVGGTKL